MNNNIKSKNKKTRFEPLDYLRGLIMAFVVITEHAGNSCTLPWLSHSDWTGITFTDWLFPGLVCCMGIAMVFSLKRFSKINGAFIRKVFYRGILLIVVGITLNFFDGWFSRLYDGMGSEAFMDALYNLRFYGILQRLGFVFIIGAFIIMLTKKNPKRILIIGFSIVLAYLFILGFGHGYEYSEDNIIYIVDNSIFPMNHLYKRKLFDITLHLDPEGLVSMISAIAQVLLAYGIGKLFMENKDKDINGATLVLFAYSSLIVIVGLFVSTFCPIIKRTWTSSYVLITTGITFIVLALFTFLATKKFHEKAFYVLKVLGVNALGIFVLSNFVNYIFKYIPVGEHFLKWYINEVLVWICAGDLSLASFLCSVLLLSLNWFIAWLLYRKNIIIKL